MKTIFLVLFISLCLFSCRKEDTLFQNGNTELAGNWINPQYSDTLVTYTRAETLIENEYGITFKSGDKLVVRKMVDGAALLRLLPPIMKALGARKVLL